MSAVRLVIQVLDGDEVIHEYTRATTNMFEDSVPNMLHAGMGWMQAYASAFGPKQWADDVRRVRAAKLPVDATEE